MNIKQKNLIVKRGICEKSTIYIPSLALVTRGNCLPVNYFVLFLAEVIIDRNDFHKMLLYQNMFQEIKVTKNVRNLILYLLLIMLLKFMIIINLISLYSMRDHIQDCNLLNQNTLISNHSYK